MAMRKRRNKEYYEFDPDTGKIERQEGIFSKEGGWTLFKQVTGMVASGCASVVVNKYLKSNMPDSANLAERVIVGVGVYFITGIVGSKVAKYAEQELEDWRENFEAAVKGGAADDGAEGGEAQ